MGRWDGDRSRSPGGQTISRVVASFGRYAGKRPKGLIVDKEGSMKLRNLMDVWGNDQGYSEDQVLHAIRKNMFYDGSSGNLRFTIEADCHEEICIKVKQKNAVSNANWGRWGKSSDGGWEAETDARVTPTPSRSAAWSAVKAEVDEDEGMRVKAEPEEDDGAGCKGQWSSSASKWDQWKADDKWSGSGGGEAWDSKSSWKASSWAKDDREGKSRWGYEGEQVQRWVGYVLKRGHQELGITLQDEGALLVDLASALAYNKPDFGIRNAQELRELLERTDTAGRFEIDGADRVRKVQRDYRQPHSHRGAGGAPAKTAPWREAEPAPPAPPGLNPGPGWQVFQDNGVIWYYYEGPEGRWWCQNCHETPQPFSD